MTDYKKYINALRKCAKEHENDRTFTGHIIVSDLCEDTAKLLEVLEKEPCDGCIIKEQLVRELNAQVAVNALTKETAQDMLDHLPSIQPTAKENLVVGDCISREFIEIVINYPPADLCVYPEYKGKPYYSIKYRENGENHVGFGTYKIEMLSQWIKEYFISDGQTKLKTGHWKYYRNNKGDWVNECSACGLDAGVGYKYSYCPNCGAKMEVEE